MKTNTIAVINYGAGNLPNVVRALHHVGASISVTDQADEVRCADAVVLPGVGATRDTMESLRRLGMTDALPEVVQRGRPFLGICVGMQVLCTSSDEFGSHACLNIVPGTVQRLPDGQKVPQIGWNQVCYHDQARSAPLFADIPDGSNFYFVHSYYCNLSDPALVAATTDYGLDFPCALIRDTLAAVQFHPEKSGKRGLQLLRNFAALAGAIA